MATMQTKLLAAALGVSLAFFGDSDASRAVPPAPTATRIYTRDRFFRLPVALDDQDRAALTEVRLYVKEGPGDAWKLKESAPPTKNAFDFRVMQDGEYWFTIATIDRGGKMAPADLKDLIPGLIVLVDTQPPEITLRVLPGDLVKCDVNDANPDPRTLWCEYLGTDGTWRSLDPVVGSPGVYRMTVPVAPGTTVRARATDRAGNTAVAATRFPGAAPLESKPAAVASLPSDVHAAPQLPLALESKPAAVGSVASDVKPAGFTALTSESRYDKAPAPPAARVDPVPAGRQLVGSTHVSLDYQIEQQGPSGISKVEVWTTKDEGLTWQRLCEDRSPHHRSPVEFDLPGEGVFGVSVVVTNGSGIGGNPPARGDTPDYWVEVDVTKPAAQLVGVRPGSGDDAGTVQVNWVASDKNLGPTPVDLYFAAQPGGPWTQIAHGIRNEGNYRWKVVRDSGPNLYFRIDVTDRAGNLTRCVSAEPLVMDLARPRARVLGITASAPRTASPVGN
jgi:hypothetical protein